MPNIPSISVFVLRTDINVDLAAQPWEKEAPYRNTWNIRHVFHKLRMLEKNASSLMFFELLMSSVQVNCELR